MTCWNGEWRAADEEAWWSASLAADSAGLKVTSVDGRCLAVPLERIGTVSDDGTAVLVQLQDAGAVSNFAFRPAARTPEERSAWVREACRVIQELLDQHTELDPQLPEEGGPAAVSTETPSPSLEQLQFDRVDDGAALAAATCAACKGDVGELYFEINGLVTCGSCRDQAERARRTGGGARVAKAFAYGTAAAAAGAGLWYGIAATTGYELGLVAIVVGLAVGFAVRRASDGRGGPGYQAIAMVLTYLAIVSTYVPQVLGGMDAALAKRSTVSTDAAQVLASQPEVPQPPVQRNWALTAIGILLALAWPVVAIFTVGFQAVMGLIIVGIALYEAWRITRRAPWVVKGPFRIGQAAA